MPEHSDKFIVTGHQSIKGGQDLQRSKYGPLEFALKLASLQSQLDSGGTDGTDGTSIAEVYIYRRASPAPLTPSGGQYQFSDHTLTAPTTPDVWYASISNVPDSSDPMYVCAATAVKPDSGTIDTTLSWSAPVRVFSDGSSGLSVDIIYCRVESEPPAPVSSTSDQATLDANYAANGNVNWYTNVADVPADGNGQFWGSVGNRSAPGDPFVWQVPVKLEGDQGRGQFTLTGTANLQIAGNFILKYTGAALWNAHAWSEEKFQGGAYATFRPPYVNKDLVAGLTQNNAGSTTWSDVEYGWLLSEDGSANALASGTALFSMASFTANDLFSVVYDGAEVRWYHNNQLKHTAPASANLILGFDSWFMTLGGRIDSIGFGHAGTRGADGDKFYSGAGSPIALGLSGTLDDNYLDKLTGDVWKHDGSTWIQDGNIAGDDGDHWHSGDGAPSVPVADSKIGDMYLNSLNGDVYERTGNEVWTLVGNIRGTPGADSVIALLSNESHTVAADSSGAVASWTGVETTIAVYEGATDATGSWTLSKADTSCSSTLTGATVQVTAMSADTAYVDITATKTGQPTQNKRFTITKSRAGPDGTPAKLVHLEATAQTFKYDRAGAPTPTSIAFTATAQGSLSGSPVFTVAAGTATLTGTGTSRSLAAADLSSEYATILVTWDGQTDRVSVAKVVDGPTGPDGLSVAELLVFRRATSTPSTPTNGSYTFETKTLVPPTLPDQWYASPPAGTGRVYVSLGLATIQGTTGMDEDLDWSAAVPAFEDGSSVNAVFKREATQPTTPSPSAGVPAGWSDDVAGTTGSLPLWVSYGLRTSVEANYTWQVPVRVEGGAGTGQFVLGGSIGMLIEGNTAEKIAGGTGWNEHAFTEESYEGASYCTFSPAQANSAIMAGLNADPELDASFTSLDYAWYMKADGNLEVRSPGGTILTPDVALGTYVAGTRFSVVYDGESVRWMKDGATMHTLAVASGLSLHFDSSFNAVGGKLNSIGFGPSGPKGTDGATPGQASAEGEKDPHTNDGSNYTLASVSLTAGDWHIAVHGFMGGGGPNLYDAYAELVQGGTVVRTDSDLNSGSWGITLSYGTTLTITGTQTVLLRVRVAGSANDGTGSGVSEASVLATEVLA